MSITLSLETQKLLENRLKSGEYESPDQLVHAALEALEELSTAGLDDATLDAIDHAEGQVGRGEVHDWKAIREEVRTRLLGR